MSRYLNHRKLGDTRYSEVWACHDQAGNWFARKLLKATAPQVVLSRFVQEVRILSKLDHAHIIKVVDAGLDASPSWFVMPLYKSSLSAERAAIAAHPERIEPLFSRVLDAVEYAHREGVIHRDLKLDNILWNSDTELAVADFGIGRLLSATEGRMTDTRIGMGTEMYMAPEQAVDAKRADARSDVFSLGRVLYELHTGQQLTPVQDVSFLMQEVGEVIRKCTLADPAERYQSVGELKDAWRSASGRYTAVFQDATVPALIKQVAAQPGSTIPVKALLEALSSPSLTPDVMRECLVRVPVQAIGTMCVVDIPGTRHIIEVFTEHIRQQNWGTTYSFKLARFVEGCFVEIQDARIRGQLLASLIVLAANSQHFGIWQIVHDLCGSISDDPSDRQVIESLKKLAPEVRQAAGQSLDLSETIAKVRTLFQ